MIFDGWSDITRVLLIGTLAYIGLVILLRVSGNRTLSKMNSFDLVVTVAFGSTLSAILTNKDVSLMEGLSAIALLVLLQFVITWLAVRSRSVSNIIKTRPSLLLKDGSFLDESMKRVRVTEDEIRAAVRQHGIACLDEVAAVIMETDASLSVIRRDDRNSFSALKGIAGFDERTR
jgi:uncharacterized membrane protein YcaP (DUF421 family)